MTGPKLVEFKKKEEPKQFARLPTEVDLEAMIGKGSKMRSCLAFAVNEYGDIGYWLDNLSHYEAVGLMEDIKGTILGGYDDE